MPNGLGRRNVVLKHEEDESGIYRTQYPNGAIAQRITVPCKVCVEKRERPLGDGNWTISYNGKLIPVCDAHKTNLDRAAEIQGLLQYDPFNEWWK